MENKKPNVILILTDDQGYGDIGIHDNEHIETPTLDRLGENSVRFHNFHASPVCAPTRASLLTGRNFLKTGVSHVHGGRDFVNIDEVMLPEVLKDNGYKTAMMGKWHSGKTNAYLPTIVALTRHGLLPYINIIIVEWIITVIWLRLRGGQRMF